MSIQCDEKNANRTAHTEPMLMIDRRDEKRKNVKIIGQILAATSASLGAGIAGTTLSWTSPCIEYFQEYNTTRHFTVTTEEGSWIGSLLAIGALLSAIPSGYCADRFGRKNSILSLSIPYIFSWVLIIKATNIGMLYIGRIFAGIGIGGTCTIVPMYLAEIVEDATRGPICSLFPLLFSIGVLLTFIVKLWTEYYMLSYVLSIIPVLFGITFMFMPESPKFLIERGKDKEAKDALHFLRGEFFDVNSEIMDIKKNLCNTTGDKASLIEIVRDRIYLKTLIACIILFIFQQLSGINAVVFYTVPIFKAAQSNLDPLVSSILVTSVQVFVTILVMFIVDKFGRKFYLIQSSVIMSICLFLLGLYFHLRLNGITNDVLNLIPLISLMVFVFTFSLGFGPIPWIIVGEINTAEIIGTISGIAMVANWTSGFMVTKTFGPMLESIGPHWTFYVYSIFNVLSTVLVLLFVPETRFKQPHEIFAKKN